MIRFIVLKCIVSVSCPIQAIYGQNIGASFSLEKINNMETQILNGAKVKDAIFNQISIKISALKVREKEYLALHS